MNINQFEQGPPGFEHLDPAEQSLLIMEKKKRWGSCINKTILQFALPLALGQQILKIMWKANKVIHPVTFFGHISQFSFNLFIYGIFAFPYCNYKLNKEILQDKRLRGHEDRAILFPGQETAMTDVKMSSDTLSSDLTEPSFSSFDMDLDFATLDKDGPIMEDDESKSKGKEVPQTSYSELREQHRQKFYSSFQRRVPPPQEPLTRAPRENPGPSSYFGSFDDRFSSNNVKKNKYGDEMET